MKNVITFILLFLLSVLTFQSITVGQDSSQTAPEFPIGAFMSTPDGTHKYNQALYDTFKATGMNIIVQHANTGTQSFMDSLMVIADNSASNSDWIPYYATGLYSKWESEEDQQNLLTVGVKHKYGKDTTWQNVDCWSSIGLNEPKDSLVYGPHYRQTRLYKRWYQLGAIIQYTARFNMALNNPTSVSQSEEVCVIKVVHRYKADYGTHTEVIDTILLRDTLKVSDFNQDGNFELFDFNGLNYSYDDKFYRADQKGMQIEVGEDTSYSDSEGGLGIQFCVNWLRDDTLCTLFIDYAEVYDNDGWNFYIDPQTHNQVIANIQIYSQSYSGWDNLKFWYAHDEPFSIDAIVPMKVVGGIVENAGGKPLITAQLSGWKYVNGDEFNVRYFEGVQPEVTMIDWFPFAPNDNVVEKLEGLRWIFDYIHSIDPDFWYVGQAQGWFQTQTQDWCQWRKPDSTEMKASVMLAFAHGVKGIVLYRFEPSYTAGPHYNCEWGYTDAIIDSNLNPTDLWYVIKDNLVPRLKGKLGKTLLTLSYTGDYINIEYQEGPPVGDNEHDYLTIDHHGFSYFWHAGFLERVNQPDNKHFLLTNLRTNFVNTAKLQISNTTNYKNLSFTDIEGGNGRADTTIGYNSSITYYDTIPAGDGRLYRVAPVVKYGGKLIYNETISEDINLLDDIIVESGVTLTVNANYNVFGNITLKHGATLKTTEDGKIYFKNGKTLTIEGSVNILGTTASKLLLDFTAPNGENGIVIKEDGLLDISYCKIEGAETGIKAELNAANIEAHYVEFDDCNSFGIFYPGTISHDNSFIVEYCTFTNIQTGIFAASRQSTIIKWNEFTDCETGIFLSNISYPNVLYNSLTSNSPENVGIFLESCSGEIRGNTVTGFTNGIHLGNSSPKVGGNWLYNNLYHGIYLGSGSNPNMKGELAGSPPNYYPVAGYNIIEENGGWLEVGGPSHNDGSEIYFAPSSNAVLKQGCNSILDPRTPSGNLVTTQYLLGSQGGGFPIVVKADENYWGDPNNPYPLSTRFSNLIVYYQPYKSDHCPLPQGGGEEMVMYSFTGEVIDTIYSIEETPGELSETELLYSEANEQFYAGEYNSALTNYNQITLSEDSLNNKLTAYNQLLILGKYLNKNSEYFEELQTTYSAEAQTTEDSLHKKVLEQLVILSTVAETDYVNAIEDFDDIVQNNPNTEEALYAEIDALTTAMLIETGDTTLNKTAASKYMVGKNQFGNKFNQLLKQNFGKNNETEEEIIPTEYLLYQNYPNPFNPVTTIKYDLPEAGDVSLVIFDILGRKIKQLVNENQQAGSYEVYFNASSIASGVYLYQLRSDNFISSKKMILIK